MTRKKKFVGPLYIEDDDLSVAWARTVAHISEHTGTEISPLIISITGFDDTGAVKETSEIRMLLDDLLVSESQLSVEQVAFTIFPQRYWVMAQGDRHKLFELYKKAYPRLKKCDPRNKHGLYFERLTMFGDSPNGGNQLETILLRLRKGFQRMQMQATTYDPKRDQTGTAIQGFPCLQHITFAPTSEGLVLNAFYATQQLFLKAYGNYLGLAQLGAFMAKEMNLKMARLNVFVGIEKLEKVAKSDPRIVDIINLVNENSDGEP